MTADEFLQWDDGTDTRYELVNGQAFAMAPPSDAHGTIVINAGLQIRRLLEDRPPCRAVAEAGIRLNDHNHYRADIAATCAEPAAAPYLEAPFLIVEVLSESTSQHDLGVKVPHYIELPSVREIWLIDSRERWVQIWRRAEETWIVSLLLRGAAEFASDALGERIGLDALYRDTGL
jgi:Uma2 family endonuclease